MIWLSRFKRKTESVMRNFASYLLLCTLFLSILSCSKSLVNDGPGEVYGNWKLTETMFDPGDGSGKYQKVKETKYLTISRNGEMTGDALPDITSFKILDSVRMEVTSKTYKNVLTYRYKATASTLMLNPPCIEGCGYRFIRQ